MLWLFLLLVIISFSKLYVSLAERFLVQCAQRDASCSFRLFFPSLSIIVFFFAVTCTHVPMII